MKNNSTDSNTAHPITVTKIYKIVQENMKLFILAYDCEIIIWKIFINSGDKNFTIFFLILFKVYSKYIKVLLPTKIRSHAF